MRPTALSLGYSPCPNDTFLFHALAHDRIACPFRWHITLADVEALNQNARTARLDVTKLSFAAIGHLLPAYGLLRSGAALGRGCGPLIVAKADRGTAPIPEGPIAVPGLWTTACLLLGLYLKQPPETVVMRFDEIMPAVARGEVDAGVIIHEGRFTYPRYGLKQMVDLGQWWEEETGLPIPLGGIAIRRELGGRTACQVEEAIRDSVIYGFSNPEESEPYVRAHAQEMASDVVRQHIDLYVNQFTRDLGEAGEAAVRAFLEKGRAAGILPRFDGALFACSQA